jgi:hypothetical protein
MRVERANVDEVREKLLILKKKVKSTTSLEIPLETGKTNLEELNAKQAEERQQKEELKRKRKEEEQEKRKLRKLATSEEELEPEEEDDETLKLLGFQGFGSSKKKG